MARTVDINVYMLASTNLEEHGLNDWLGNIAEGYELPEATVNEQEAIISLAAKRCYMSFKPGLNPNITKVREDLNEHLKNILKQGHGSVLEHSSFTFAFENVSRVFTGEMNRHRAGWAISEGSMRFIRFDDIPYWVPTSIQGVDTQPSNYIDFIEILGNASKEEFQGMDLEQRKHTSRMIFERAFKDAEKWYSLLVKVWNMKEGDHNFDYKKKITSMLRRIIPMGVATGGVWTGNVRALRHVIEMRTSPAAEEEILFVFSKVAELMSKQYPALFGDFKQVEGGYWVPDYHKV